MSSALVRSRWGLLGCTLACLIECLHAGIVLCELIGRVEADPDIMPRTNSFGVDQEVFR